MKRVSKYGYSDIGDRKENEDAFGIYIYGKNLITVVADGLGGQGDGKRLQNWLSGNYPNAVPMGVFQSQTRYPLHFLLQIKLC